MPPNENAGLAPPEVKEKLDCVEAGAAVPKEKVELAGVVFEEAAVDDAPKLNIGLLLELAVDPNANP